MFHAILELPFVALLVGIDKDAAALKFAVHHVALEHRTV
jgi:hypothetical protein